MERNDDLWQQIADLSGGRKNPFEDPYGPTPECFSDNDVVRMFQLGAERRGAVHLRRCDPCQTRVQAFAQLTGSAVPETAVSAHVDLDSSDRTARSIWTFWR